MRSGSFTKKRWMHFVPALVFAALAMQGCHWHDDQFKRYAGDRGEVEPCKGICISESIPKNKDACKTNPDKHIQYLWTEDKCMLGEKYLEVDNEEACGNAEGMWIPGECKVLDSDTCATIGGVWADFQLYDMGNGQYIRVNGDKYYCGNYQQIADNMATECSSVDNYIEDIKHGLCNSTSFCRLMTLNDNDVAACTSCPSGNVKCGNECVDIMNNPHYCGSCNTDCVAEGKDVCDNGECRNYDCPVGHVECMDETIGKLQCFDVKNNKDHCGIECKKCEDHEKCTNGQCIAATECLPEQIKCFCNDKEGICKNVETPNYEVKCITPTEPETCGATDCENFGKQCKPGQICSNGDCVCPNNLVLDCNSGECLDPKSEMSCGVTLAQVASGTITQCGSNEYCDGSACRCKSGYARENDSSPCIDILSDNNNCGKINNQCLSNSSCINGQCICDKGFVLCNNQCLIPLKDTCCGFEEDENSTTPFDICDGKLDLCTPVEGSKHVYECVCRNSDVNGNCIDLNSNNNYCGDNKENCENIAGGAYCMNGKCKCNNENAEIQTDKDGQKVCAEISHDPNCCGVECKKCDTNQVCEDRTCKNQCVTSGNINCNGHCLDKDVYHVEEDEDNPGNCKCGFDLSTNRMMCPDVNVDPNFGCAVAYKGDNNNCGGCGIACKVDQVCVGDALCRCGTMNGVLHYECAFSPNSYYNNEVEMTICMPSTYFSENHVVVPTTNDCSKCEENYDNVDGDLANGCEVDLKTTIKHCGSKNNDCNHQIQNALGITCEDGKCVAKNGCSSTDFMDCNEDSTMEVPDGCETNITTSTANCGKCGNICASDALCEGGNCCYSENTNIKLSNSQFQCCAGNNLYEYKPNFAFPFCWGSARYACSTEKEKMDSDSCWYAVE